VNNEGYMDRLEAENRDLRLLLGILLARADGRIEVTDREIVEGTEVQVHRNVGKGVTTITAHLPGR
jgi:hypothetical protein